MAVTADAQSFSNYATGTNKSISAQTWGSGAQSQSFFMTVGSGATDLIMQLNITGDFASVVPITANWDSTGTNQSMTLLGSGWIYNSNLNQSSAYFGLVNPTSGAKTIGYNFTGSPSNIATWLASFQGGAGVSVGNDFVGFNSVTDSGAGTALSISSGASIASGGVAITTWKQSANSWTGFPSDGGTEIDINAQALATEYIATTGATVNASATAGGSTRWTALIVGIVPAGGGGSPLRRNSSLSGLGASGPFFHDPLARIILGWIPGLILPWNRKSILAHG